jgi:hypothetical protein
MFGNLILFFQIMVTTCKGVRAEWSTESLKLAVCAVISGTPLAAASRIYSIPIRITGFIDGVFCAVRAEVL